MQLNNYYTFFDYLFNIYHEWLASLQCMYEVDRLGKFSVFIQMAPNMELNSRQVYLLPQRLNVLCDSIQLGSFTKEVIENKPASSFYPPSILHSTIFVQNSHNLYLTMPVDKEIGNWQIEVQSKFISLWKQVHGFTGFFVMVFVFHRCLILC